MEKGPHGFAAYVYEAREKLGDQWVRFSTEEERRRLSEALDSAESWLYDEGADQPKVSHQRYGVLV